jgi:hypothetical protein
MPAKCEEEITQEKHAGGAVANSVMRGEDKGAVPLLMEQYGAEERRVIRSERCTYLFGNFPLPPRKGRCDHAKGDALAWDAAKVRDTVDGGVNAGREQRVALLHRVKRVTPLLNGCAASNLCCECTVRRKLLVEKTKQLLKGAQRTE